MFCYMETTALFPLTSPPFMSVHTKTQKWIFSIFFPAFLSVDAAKVTSLQMKTHSCGHGLSHSKSYTAEVHFLILSKCPLTVFNAASNRCGIIMGRFLCHLARDSLLSASGSLLSATLLSWWLLWGAVSLLSLLLLLLLRLWRPRTPWLLFWSCPMLLSRTFSRFFHSSSLSCSFFFSLKRQRQSLILTPNLWEVFPAMDSTWTQKRLYCLIILLS